MKTTCYQKLAALLIFLSLPFWAAADNDYEKTYSKSFSSQDVEELSIYNKYGDVNIKNWNKQEISIKVKVTVEARNESEAQSLFRDIEVMLQREGSKVIGRTGFEMKTSHGNFSVNYEVFTPKSMNAVIENKYGDVYINELTGHLSLKQKYGALRINKLKRGDKSPHNEIDISYCENSHIRECGWLKLNMDYSEIEIERSTALMILSRYSQLYTKAGNSIVAEGKYDDFRLGTLDKFIVETKYSDIKIEKLQNRLEAEMKYTDMEVEEIPAGFSTINLDVKYGGIELGVASDASYKLDADMQYAEIDIPSEERISVDEGYTDKQFKGYVGQEETPTSSVKIKSRYCDVELD